MILQQEIEDVVKTIILPKPIFKLRTSGLSVCFEKVDKLSSNSTSPIKDLVLDCTNTVWDKQNCAFKIKSADCINGIRSQIVIDIVDFILMNSKSKNPRLTGTYQWYKLAISSSALVSYPALEDMLFETWKYMIGGTQVDQSNVMNILEVIRYKFENKGLKK